MWLIGSSELDITPTPNFCKEQEDDRVNVLLTKYFLPWIRKVLLSAFLIGYGW